jgi:hypothetical protein
MTEEAVNSNSLFFYPVLFKKVNFISHILIVRLLNTLPLLEGPENFSDFVNNRISSACGKLITMQANVNKLKNFVLH